MLPLKVITKVGASLENTCSDTLTSFIKSGIAEKIGESVTIESGFCRYTNTLKWVMSHSKKIRDISIDGNVLDGLYINRLSKDDIMIVSLSTKIYAGSRDAYRLLNVRFIGKNQKHYRANIIKYGSYNNNSLYTSIRTYYNRGYVSDDIIVKSFNDIICTKKDLLLNKIDTWRNNSTILTAHGIINSIGILLYGQPGTGKTSIVRALAKHYNAEIFILIGESFDQANIKSSINGYRSNDHKSNTVKPVILLIEDIDCIINDIKPEIEANRMKNLLQFLDGIDSVQNTIIVATTNFYDKLDSRLLRDGRFDICLEVEEFNYLEAVQYCEMFKFNKEKIDSILENETYPINPAYLQNKVIQSITNI